MIIVIIIMIKTLLKIADFGYEFQYPPNGQEPTHHFHQYHPCRCLRFASGRVRGLVLVCGLYRVCLCNIALLRLLHLLAISPSALPAVPLSGVATTMVAMTMTPTAHPLIAACKGPVLASPLPGFVCSYAHRSAAICPPRARVWLWRKRSGVLPQ